MIIYFADRSMNILGMAGTELPGSLVIRDDLRTIDIDSGVSVFDFRIQYAPADRSRAEELCRAGNYLLRDYKGRQEFYTVITNENDTEKGEIYVYSEDAGLDLLNETAPAYTAPQAYPIAFYLEKYIYDSGFEIGVNEIPSLTRTLKWEGESTVTERLRSIATQFDDAEIGFRFVIDKLSVKHKYLDVYKRRGSDTDVMLRIGREVKNIIVKESIEGLATALRVTGGTPEGANTPVTLQGYTYDDGDMYVSGKYLFSREALKKWSRYVSRDESGSDLGHIVKSYSYDTTSQATLCAHAVTQLKKICEMDVSYEIELLELPDSVGIGDRVNIIDRDGDLYLSARILELKECAVADTCKVTLGDYLAKSSGINAKLEELSAKYQELTAKSVLHTWIAYADDPAGTNISTDPTGKTYMGISGNHLAEEPDLTDPTAYTWSLIQGAQGSAGEDAVLLRIDSSRGLVFKNDMFSTVLSVVIIKGAQTITSLTALQSEFGIGACLQWQYRKYTDEEWQVMSSADSHIAQNGFQLTITPSDVDEQIIFQCDLII